MTDGTDTVDADNGLWLSMAEIGRRQNPPVSREAVRKRVERFVRDGLLSTRPGPGKAILVNWVAYDRLVRSETDPAQALRNGREDERPATGGSFSASRAERESYQAENARLDLEERLGRLVDRSEILRLIADVFRRHRDRLLSVPARYADRLAAAPDAAAARSLLTTALRQELDAFAGMLDAIEAGGDAMDTTDDAADDGDAAAGERPTPTA